MNYNEGTGIFILVRFNSHWFINGNIKILGQGPYKKQQHA